MCEEKVERLSSIDCLSPMSTRTSSKTVILLPSLTGMRSPHITIRVRSPTVFRVTVFPPVLGPVMIRAE